MSLAARRLLHLKPWRQILLTIATIYFLLFHFLPAIESHYNHPSTSQYPLPESLDPTEHEPPYTYPSTLTTNLILASTRKDNLTWTLPLYTHLPHLKIYRYISDDPSSKFHSPVPNKGREALMYLTYLRDFHNISREPHSSSEDGLADINIFIHAESFPWHADSALWKSMLFTLAHLDLEQVLKDGYVNLRTTWGPSEDAHNCPNGGFNTSKTYEESRDSEEYWMREAFETNFPGEELPEMFSGPCCSQFAVSRERIRWRRKDIYEKAVDWLVETVWPDSLVGRVWEHMWPWLFLGKANDCGREEWRTLCVRFGVCFEDGEGLKGFNDLWDEREALRENEDGFWRELLRPWRVTSAMKVVENIGVKLERLLVEAVERGKQEEVREAAGKEQSAQV